MDITEVIKAHPLVQELTEEYNLIDLSQIKYAQIDYHFDYDGIPPEWGIPPRRRSAIKIGGISDPISEDTTFEHNNRWVYLGWAPETHNLYYFPFGEPKVRSEVQDGGES